jgi:Zinc finger, C3HC4 type (RING finger)
MEFDPLLQPELQPQAFVEFDVLEDREETESDSILQDNSNGPQTSDDAVPLPSNNDTSINRTNPHVQAAAASVRGRQQRVTFDLPNNPHHRGRRVFRIPHGSRVTIRHRTNGATRILQQPLHYLNPTAVAVLPPDAGATATLSSTMPPFSTRLLPVDALAPTPLADHLQVKHREAGSPQRLPSSSDNDDDEQLIDEIDFDCVICYDTLIQPVGCGNCPARFCQPCLLTALKQHRQCPVCRGEVPRTIDNNNNDTVVVVDAALLGRLARYGVSCQYCTPETYDGRLHPLGVHRIPHVNCPDLQLECRLAPYGCPWRGPRRDVAQHNHHDCPYEKVTGLLEQFRLYQIRNEANLHRMVATMAAQRSPATSSSAMVPRSVFPDLPQFVALLCTNPGRLQLEPAWTPFVDARQNLEAALTCIPTVLLQIKLITTGLLDDIDSTDSNNIWNSGLLA